MEADVALRQVETSLEEDGLAEGAGPVVDEDFLGWKFEFGDVFGAFHAFAKSVVGIFLRIRSTIVV